MCRKLIHLISCIVVLSLASNASAKLVGHWNFDEGTGATAFDSSGYGNDGTLSGNASWAEGYLGGAIYLDGASWIDIPPAAWDPIERKVTVAFWAFGGDAMPVDHFVFAAFSDDINVARQASAHIPWSNGNVYWDTGYDGSAYDRINLALPTEYQKGQWVHWAFTKDCDTGEVYIYINGEIFHSGTAMTRVMTGVNDFTIGVRANSDRTLGYIGWIDDFRLYDEPLTADRIQEVMLGEGYPYAFKPSPENGALLEANWVTLSWSSGAFATSHDVYMGENFDDVNNATTESEVYRGNYGTTFFVAGFPGYPYPEGLVPGTTYYWRIDEVNEANSESPWKGEIWSFIVPSKKAYDPKPADGAMYIENEGTVLTWTPGQGAVLHTVYFGEDADTVANATGGVPKAITTFDPGPLELEKTYYWRVDEFDGTTTHIGDVWSFTTMPIIEMSDPNLVSWWTLDEGSGSTALDWSGHGHHSAIGGTPDFVPGYDGDALDFDGVTNYIDVDERIAEGIFTLTMWIRPRDIPYASGFYAVMHNDQWDAGSVHIHLRNSAWDYPTTINADINGGPNVTSTTVLQADQWYHCALTVDTVGGSAAQLYINGVLEDTSTEGTGTAYLGPLNFGAWTNNQRFYHGLMDDIRIYDKVLTADEVLETMRGDPTLAWDPSPANGSMPDIDAATPLTWSPGDNASQHDVYFGADKDAVSIADASDVTGVYRGRQNATTYTPPEGVEWGGGPYYWRIDEYNTDGTISKGRIWSFVVTDFILVDDFESYTDNDVAGQAIWQAWIDGFGVADNGAQVGYLLPPYAEQTIVHSGGQSMPLLYDNTAGVTNSEAVLSLTTPRDWIAHGLTTLSLWFRGYPASTGGFVEAPAGTYTVTGSGADIWGTADQFHFAFKTLTGAGTITARVNSVQNTNAWAKAGVMIRETLDAGSKHAFAAVTPDNGVAFQGRSDINGASFNTNQTGLTAPYWVKLERDVSGNFAMQHSANGTTWQQVQGAMPQNISMSSNVYIGLAVTSHDAALACSAVFTNVTTTGNISGQWAHQDIGISSNAAEPLYVAVSNSAGSPAIVAHDDPDAATIDEWTEWIIPLQTLVDQGINLTDVDKIAIGLGSKSGVVTSGGSGIMYFDDIRLYRPMP
jgi:hypothetical protein